MGQNMSNGGGHGSPKQNRPRSREPNDNKKEESSKGRALMPTFGKRKKLRKGTEVAKRLPKVLPNNKCRLRLLKLHRISDWLLLEEEFLQRSQINASHEVEDPKKKEAEEANRELLAFLRGSPMKVMNLEEVITEDKVIISENGFEWYVSLMSFVDKEQLEPNCSVLVNRKTMAVVGVIEDTNPKVNVMRVERAPTESFADIGGLEKQIQELKEAVELPLTHPELYEELGVKPPKGVILHGPPGTGKTLLAKAVANQTSATFLHVVGSELIQKYLGEGPKLVRDVFRLAEELAPTIIFIDEIDAIGYKRYDTNSGGEREIQRTMLELLNQLDGFDTKTDIKVIMATNRIASLDPALIRPGRIDRKIEVILPNEATKRKIFHIHSQRMSLASDVNFELISNQYDDLSGADIKAICTEAGLIALRDRRKQATVQDFQKAKQNVLFRKKDDKNAETLYL